MSLDDLLALLDRTPAVVDIHPVSTVYLPKEVIILDSAAEVAWQLDAPEPMLPGKILITASDSQGRSARNRGGRRTGFPACLYCGRLESLPYV